MQSVHFFVFFCIVVFLGLFCEFEGEGDGVVVDELLRFGDWDGYIALPVLVC